MSNGRSGLYKLGGISFVASGLLFLAKSVLELVMGPPPSSGSDILVWRDSQRSLLAINSEIFFFAVSFMVPAVIALYESLASTRRSHAAFGCGMMAATIPVFYGLAIVQGRLMYPVFHIEVHTPELAEFIVATYVGGLHAAAILLTIATFVVSLAMRHSAFGSKIAYLGFATAVFDLVGSYPDAIGPTLVFVSGMFFTAWFLVVGVKLHRMPAAALS